MAGVDEAAAEAAVNAAVAAVGPATATVAAGGEVLVPEVPALLRRQACLVAAAGGRAEGSWWAVWVAGKAPCWSSTRVLSPNEVVAVEEQVKGTYASFLVLHSSFAASARGHPFPGAER